MRTIAWTLLLLSLASVRIQCIQLCRQTADTSAKVSVKLLTCMVYIKQSWPTTWAIWQLAKKGKGKRETDEWDEQNKKKSFVCAAIAINSRATSWGSRLANRRSVPVSEEIAGHGCASLRPKCWVYLSRKLGCHHEHKVHAVRNCYSVGLWFSKMYHYNLGLKRFVILP